MNVGATSTRGGLKILFGFAPRLARGGFHRRKKPWNLNSVTWRVLEYFLFCVFSFFFGSNQILV